MQFLPKNLTTIVLCICSLLPALHHMSPLPSDPLVDSDILWPPQLYILTKSLLYAGYCIKPAQLWIQWSSLYQTEIYKLSLTNISQSDCLSSVPAQQRPSSPNPPSPLPRQLFKLPASPVLMPPLHPLAYLFSSRGLPLCGPYTSKLKARKWFRERRNQTYPHVA